MRKPSWLGLALFIGCVALLTLAMRRHLDVELELTLARAPEVREVSLIFSRNERVERALDLRFADGAAARERRRVRLAEGDYSVGARIRYSSGEEKTQSRALHVEREGTYALEF